MNSDQFLGRLQQLANALDEAHQLVDHINIHGGPTQRINLRALLIRGGIVEPMTFDRVRRAIDSTIAEVGRRAA